MLANITVEPAFPPSETEEGRESRWAGLAAVGLSANWGGVKAAQAQLVLPRDLQLFTRSNPTSNIFFSLCISSLSMMMDPRRKSPCLEFSFPQH